MKFEIEVSGDTMDTLFVEFLRKEADVVWHSLQYVRGLEKPKEFQKEDLWYNYKLLGAMYRVEEYFSDNPKLREMYPRDEELNDD